jgi:hypothetical protein
MAGLGYLFSVIGYKLQVKYLLKVESKLEVIKFKVNDSDESNLSKSLIPKSEVKSD